MKLITLNVNFELTWCDDMLMWNTTEQLCINRRNRSEIFFTPYEIWTPDIVAINGPGKPEKIDKYRYPVLVICTGLVRWSYQDKIVSFCEIDIQNFPFDRQYCSILLQSTIHDSSQLKLRSLYNVVRLYNFINTEWEITHATIEEINLFNPQYALNFSTIKINIELVRLSRFYIIKIIIPFSIISSLALFSFCLPTDSGEKVALTVSVLLSLTIYLQVISKHVPKTERGFCILTLYSNIIFLFVFLSCIFNIFTVFIYYHELYSIRNKIPKRQEKPVLFSIHQSLLELNKQRWTFLRKRQNIVENLPEQTGVDAVELLYDIRYVRELLTTLHIRKNSNDLHHYLFHPQQSFKQMAVRIDRILFFIYLISMPLSLAVVLKFNYQPRLSLAKNQLLDLRKVAFDPLPLYRQCPT